MSSNSTCNCQCANVLAFLKYKNPEDFCDHSECLEWGDDLEQCYDCSCISVSKKYCLTHQEKHKLIKCYYCNKNNCVSKFLKDDWVFLLNNKGFACSDCRHRNLK